MIQPVTKILDYRRAEFLTSARELHQCPPDQGWEVAFAGRSNSGKSSGINALAGNRKLARASKTPGRTQLINFFSLSENQRLVDLPGYGFAKAPEAARRAWAQQMETYLEQRRSLRGLVLMMDCRRPPGQYDKVMLNWASSALMPVRLLLTKADKLSRGAAGNTLLTMRTQLAARGGPLGVQLFSVVSGTGLQELQDVLNDWLTDAGASEEDAYLG